MTSKLQQHSLESFVRSALAERYVTPVVRGGGDQPLEVPPGNALQFARARAAEAGFGEVERRIVAIDMSALEWYRVPPGGLRLWRQHGTAEPVGGELVTEVVEGDPALQLVASHEGWQLVRLVDGAQGWVEPVGRPLEAAGAPTVRGEVVDVDPHAFAVAVEGMLGVPYRWGGSTAGGIDCSGLVQRAAWTVGRCWLPRHSTALLRIGHRVAPSSVARGDVLVLRRHEGASVSGSEHDNVSVRDDFDPHGGPAVHPMHVAVAVSAGEAVHASRDAWKVVREDVASLRARFRVLSVRRLGPVD